MALMMFWVQKLIAVDAFQARFMSSCTSNIEKLLDHIPSKVTKEMNVAILKKDEVQEALNHMCIS